jgi:hypothetical protein
MKTHTQRYSFPSSLHPLDAPPPSLFPKKFCRRLAADDRPSPTIPTESDRPNRPPPRPIFAPKFAPFRLLLPLLRPHRFDRLRAPISRPFRPHNSGRQAHNNRGARSPISGHLRPPHHPM